MKKHGKIVRWDTARGFGFIRSPATPAEVFFHIRDFRGSVTPREGLAVMFEEIHVGGKGPRAMDVQIAAPVSAAAAVSSAGRATRQPNQRRGPRQSSPQRPTAHAGPTLFLMFAWAGVLTWGVWAGRLPLLVLGIVLLLNLATFFVYWRDKYAAEQRQWRTAENTLHLLSLLGGWPGAWFAQQLLRHKSSKVSFRATYWTTVALHCLLLTGWLFQARLREMLLYQ